MNSQNILLIGSILIERQFFTDIIPQANQIGYASSNHTLTSSKVINAGRVIAVNNRVSMYGSIGQDNDGLLAVEQIKQYNINTDLISSHKKLSTGQVVVTTNSKGAAAVILLLGASQELKPPELNVIKHFDFLYIETSFDLNHLYSIVHQAQKFKTKILLDIPNQQKDIDISQIRHIDFLMPNRQESELLLAQKIITIQDALHAANKLKQHIQGTIIITLDQDGCIVCQKKPIHISTRQVKPVDSTACGDIFRAIFLDEYISTHDILSSAKKATEIATASIAIRSVDNSITSAIQSIS